MSDPFGAGPWPLAGGLLRPLRTEHAQTLATGCAAIDPYRRLGFSSSGLAAYFTREDPALYRYQIEMSSLPVGVLAIRHPWLRGPFIEMLTLLPAAQGAGLGAEALQWAAHRAAAVAANLWVTVSDFNAGARRFYRRCGFTETALLDDLVGAGAAEVLMRRRLG